MERAEAGKAGREGENHVAAAVAPGIMHIVRIE